MVRRIWIPFLCLAFFVASILFSGCGHKYEDQITGITIRELGSDLDNRWAVKGVVVEAVESGSTAEGFIKPGELISYIVDERLVTDEKSYRKALSEALEEDGKATLRILKSVSAVSPVELGIQVKPDPEERGVIVDQVAPGSKAEEVGIKPDTIIYQIDGKSISSMEEYDSILNEALSGSGSATFDIARRIVASKLSKVGIEEVEKQDGSVVVRKMKEFKSEGTPASMEGLMEGDAITHVIDEMKITDIGSYKKAIKKANDADRVIFERGELGGIKLVAIDALGQIGDARAVEPLLKALDSEDRWIRRSAATALERIDDQRIIQPMMYRLLEENEMDAEVRRSAARALARMRPLESIEYLAQALNDSSLGVRLEAGYALGRIGDPAIDVLVKARNNQDSRVRDSAVAALGNIGGESAKRELISVLRDENEESTVKLTAIQALYKIGDSESIAELRRLTDTGDPGLRAFVKELLSEEVAS
jgi:membrane-associated protease RseP (regulator of RpoE activity)